MFLFSRYRFFLVDAACGLSLIASFYISLCELSCFIFLFLIYVFYYEILSVYDLDGCCTVFLESLGYP
jgi:hypothetical protein